MKNSTYKSAQKTFDIELKTLLEADLKRFKEGKTKNNQANGQLLAA